jgi:transglutaminase-like putative cysteine protease
MLIRFGYDIGLECHEETVVVAALRTHSSRIGDLRMPDPVRIDPYVLQSPYRDEFGNRLVRFVLPPGPARLWTDGIIEDPCLPDPVEPDAPMVPVADLPDPVLTYLRSSRYCDTEELGVAAWQLFGGVPEGWARVQAICDWVHGHIRFGYGSSSPRKTASDVFREGTGVCRDFAHLAITMCRAVNVPARYAAGYVPDIGVPPDPAPMDFCAWFEAYLGGHWYAFDARYNVPRTGRVLMARGRDAADAAMLTTFGANTVSHFSVHACQLEDAAVPMASGRTA